MRWSQALCLSTILFGAALNGVLARRNDYRSLDEWPELAGRSPAATRPSKDIKASSLKSSNYRNTAIKSGKAYDPLRKLISPGRITKNQATGQHADHVLEAQTVAKTLNKHGIQPGPSQMNKIKNVVNGPGNLAMVAAKQNMEKGKFSRGALSGKSPALSGATKDYMKATSSQAMGTARKLDQAVGQSIFSKTQKDIHKKAGIRRRSLPYN